MTANNTRSRKSKGQKFQKKIVSFLREAYGLDVEEEDCFRGDIQANPMGNSGRDVKLSPEAEKIIPFDVECKRVERLNIWKALEQAEENTRNGRTPLLTFRRNYGDTYACLKLEDLLELVVD